MECYIYLVNKIVHIVNLFIYSRNVLSQSQKSFRYFLLLDHQYLIFLFSRFFTQMECYIHLVNKIVHYC